MTELQTLLPVITESRGILENRRVCRHVHSGGPAAVMPKLHAVALADPQKVQGRLAVGESQIFTDIPGRHPHTVIENLRRGVTHRTLDLLQHPCQRRTHGLRRVLKNYMGATTPLSLNQSFSGQIIHGALGRNTRHLEQVSQLLFGRQSQP